MGALLWRTLRRGHGLAAQTVPPRWVGQPKTLIGVVQQEDALNLLFRQRIDELSDTFERYPHREV